MSGRMSSAMSTAGHRGVDIRLERVVLKTLRRDLADDHGDAVRPEEVVEAELPLADLALLVSSGANAPGSADSGPRILRAFSLAVPMVGS